MTAVYMADEQNFTSVFGLPRNDRAAGNFSFQKMTSLQFAAENPQAMKSERAALRQPSHIISQ